MKARECSSAQHNAHTRTALPETEAGLDTWLDPRLRRMTKETNDGRDDERRKRRMMVETTNDQDDKGWRVCIGANDWSEGLNV